MKYILFIGTNIFLEFYRFSQSTLDELKKIVTLIEDKKINLLLPKQVEREVWRNRESVIEEALTVFKKNTSFSKGMPVFMGVYPQAKEYNNDLEKMVRARQELIDTVRKNAIELQLPADEVLIQIFNSASKIKITSEIKKKTRWRHQIGDPPGKPDNFNDRLIWESLLSVKQKGQSLHIVTRDKDFRSSLNVKRVHPILEKEWQEENAGKICIYETLKEFLKNDFPDFATSVSDATLQDEYPSADNARDNIKETYLSLRIYGTLTDWQIIKIAQAIDAYKIGWFHLAMSCLDLALLKDEEISQESWNLERVRQAAQGIDIESMIREI